MPPKRPSDAAPSGAQLKRQRMREQRMIPVAGHAPRQGGSAGTGNTGLPAVLEVEKFAQARVFEISAMQRAMKSAKCAVPKDAAKPKRVTRKMLGRHRMRPGLKAEMFMKRQKDKLWLETHVWHAKRMHMTEIWGHRIADRPTAKAFRSSYRASQHGALVHDASYYQYFELVGPLDDLEKVLEVVCDPSKSLPTSKRYSTGAREYTTNVYDSSQSFPHGLLGPVTFIWQPDSSSPTASTDASTSAVPTSPPSRTLLVRAHPSLARDAALSFERAVQTLRLGLSVGLRRYDREFLTFEVTGRRATEVIKGVLKPVKATDEATKEAWRKLDPQAGPGGVPAGLVLGLEVYDPRLSFPPKLDKRSTPLDLVNPLVPSPTLAAVPSFWDRNHRASIHTPRYKKRDLDARRSHNLVPGTRLDPIAQDDRIPVLLTQRTLGASTFSSTQGASDDTAQHGWTLTIPSGWGMPFWTSLIYSTPRVGGQRERSHQFYEAGAPRFPEDFVGAPAFAEHEARRERDDKGYWERRPPAKRPSYAKLGTAHPWRAEMGEVLAQAWARGSAGERDEQKKPFLVPAKVAQGVLDAAARPATNGAMDEDVPPSPRARAKQLERHLVDEWRTVSISSGSVSPASLLPHAMVRVKLTPCMRGVPQDLGLVYELDEETAKEVRAKVDLTLEGEGKEAKATGEYDGAEDLCDRPSPEQVIGRITTGSYALSSGHGGGYAMLSLYRLLAMSSRGNGLSRLVLFRNRDSETYRSAVVQLADW
ncbi:hypothetical protein Rhopal_007196-T1 [Rhodotorula paludigena]|uniref:Uncharacterized protein n=1 Tax=Rhodotorula paludigena TaxID=86838 RepID=A0AAV5GXQ7_9BASI|nr:hypothetical protein Rhopal_007196-T1 [Rhodotorula paludigena]